MSNCREHICTDVPTLEKYSDTAGIAGKRRGRKSKDKFIEWLMRGLSDL